MITSHSPFGNDSVFVEKRPEPDRLYKLLNMVTTEHI